MRWSTPCSDSGRRRPGTRRSSSRGGAGTSRRRRPHVRARPRLERLRHQGRRRGRRPQRHARALHREDPTHRGADARPGRPVAAPRRLPEGGTRMTVPTDTAFAGFPREGLEFLAGLVEDNSRAYFDAHRDVYEEALLAPAKAFVAALGEQLHARIAPGLRAEPRVNGSILRINRDTRFTSDKRPYKEHLDFWFWEGDGPSRERPGLFIRLRPETVQLGAGMHHFERPVLEAYRAAVGDERTGRALETA